MQVQGLEALEQVALLLVDYFTDFQHYLGGGPVSGLVRGITLGVGQCQGWLGALDWGWCRVRDS